MLLAAVWLGHHGWIPRMHHGLPPCCEARPRQSAAKAVVFKKITTNIHGPVRTDGTTQQEMAASEPPSSSAGCVLSICFCLFLRWRVVKKDDHLLLSVSPVSYLHESSDWCFPIRSLVYFWYCHCLFRLLTLLVMFHVNIWLNHMFSPLFLHLHGQRGTSLLPLWPCEGPQTFFRIISLQLYNACSCVLWAPVCNVTLITSPFGLKAQEPLPHCPPPSPPFSIYSFWFKCRFLAKYKSVPFVK